MASERGDYDAARPFYEEGMVIFSELGDIRGIAHLIERCALIAAGRGLAERAVCLVAAAAALRQQFGAPLPPDHESQLEHTMGPIRQKLGAQASASAWTEGWEMPTERAIQYALAADKV